MRRLLIVAALAAATSAHAQGYTGYPSQDIQPQTFRQIDAQQPLGPAASYDDQARTPYRRLTRDQDPPMRRYTPPQPQAHGCIGVVPVSGPGINRCPG